MSDAPETMWRETISPSKMYPNGGSFYYEKHKPATVCAVTYRRADLVPQWQPIETAPTWRAVKVMVGEGMEFAAILNPDASYEDDMTPCDQWQAVHEGEHPPCWSGGACWASNENGDVSLQPKKWREL